MANKIKISFSALMKILTRHFSRENICVKSCKNQHMMKVFIELGTDKGDLFYDGSRGMAFAITYPWFNIIEDAIKQSLNNYERIDKPEQDGNNSTSLFSESAYEKAKGQRIHEAHFVPKT